MDEAKADIFFLIRLGGNFLDFVFLLVLDDEDEDDIIFGVGGVLLQAGAARMVHERMLIGVYSPLQISQKQPAPDTAQ